MRDKYSNKAQQFDQCILGMECHSGDDVMPSTTMCAPGVDKIASPCNSGRSFATMQDGAAE